MHQEMRKDLVGVVLAVIVDYWGTLVIENWIWWQAASDFEILPTKSEVEALCHPLMPCWTCLSNMVWRKNTILICTGNFWKPFWTISFKFCQPQTINSHPFSKWVSTENTYSSVLSDHTRCHVHSHNWRQAPRIRTTELQLDLRQWWTVVASVSCPRVSRVLFIFLFTLSSCESMNPARNIFHWWSRFRINLQQFFSFLFCLFSHSLPVEV